MKRILKYFPADLQNQLKGKTAAYEVRLRKDKPITITDGDGMFSLSHVTGERVIGDVFERICKNSVYSYADKIRQGYITLEGGCRVGFCGSYCENTIKNITSLNFRLANEVRGCADEIAKNLKPGNTLLYGKPMSGKTTVLRDLCRILGNRHVISIVDEREEISANGYFDTGKFSDVFSGYPKLVGIRTAVRTMAPEFVICDEIGKEEMCIIDECANSGVSFICTVHANNESDLEKILNLNLFQNIIPIQFKLN
jgi:stage III sporulation protein AA